MINSGALPQRLGARTIPWPLLLPLAVMALSVGLAWLEMREHRQDARVRFERLATDRSRDVEQVLANLVALQAGVANFVAQSPRTISQAAFERFVASQVLHAPISATMLAYVPDVAKRERDAFERTVRQTLNQFDLWENAAGGARTRAQQRARHFPTLYRWPVATEAIGFDWASQPEAQAAIEKAAVTRLTTMSEPFQSSAEPAGAKSYLLVVPVSLAPASSAAPAGFIVGQYRYGLSYEHAVRHQSLMGQRVWVFAPRAGVDTPVYLHPGGHRGDPVLLPNELPALASVKRLPWSVLRTVAVADQSLTFAFSTDKPTDLLSFLTGGVIALLLGGSLLSALAIWVALRRQAALVALSEQVALHAAMVNAERDAYVALDEQFKVVEWGPAAQELLGYRASEVIGKSIDKFISRADRIAVSTLFQTHVGKSATAAIEPYFGPITLGSGKTIPVEIAVSSASFGSGMRHFLSIRDISERDTAQQRLQRYQQIVDTSPEPLIFVTPDLRYGVANAAYARIANVKSSNELIGRTLQEVLPPAVWEAIEDKLHASLAGEAQKFRIDGPFPDGRQHYFEALQYPCHGIHGVEGVAVAIHDITEAVQLIARLQRYQQVVDTSPGPLFFVDRELRYELANAAYARMVNFARPEDLIGKAVAEVAVPAAYKEAQPRLRAALNGEPQQFRVASIFPDGRKHHLDVFQFPYRGPSGVEGVVVANHDVTDTVDLIAQLSGIAQKYRNLFEDAPVMYVLLAEQGGVPIVVNCNERFLLVLGYSRDQVIGRSLYDFADSESVRAWSQGNHMRKAFAGELMFEAKTLISKSGTPVVVMFKASPEEADSPDTTPLLRGTFLDITTNERLRVALAESENRFEQLVQSLPQMVWTTTPDGVLEFVSKKTYSYLGLHQHDSKQSLSEQIETAVHREDRSRLRAAWRQALSLGNETGFHIEVRARRYDGEYRWFDAEAIPMRDSAGKIQHWIGTSADITDRRNAEKQLHSAQKMEAIGQLTGGLAHDFNNLLGIVIGNLDMLATQTTDTTLHKRVQVALSAAERGADLVKSLLAVARRQPLDPQRVEVDDLLSKMQPLLRHTAGPRIVVELDFSRSGVEAVLDVAGFEAALLNLVINARDAMPSGGKLVVGLENAAPEDILGLPEANYAVIKVRDSGIGMTPDVLQRAIEPFFSTKERGRGTGLGLAMVAGFAQQSGGALRLESAPGAGTTARLCIRVVEPKVPIHATDGVSNEAPVGRERVLLVDDEPALLSLASEWLRELGYAVRTAASGDAALQLLAEERCDLLLSDIVMPGALQGIGLAQEVTRRYPNTRVMLATGYAEEFVCNPSEVTWPVLTKPYRKRELARAIRALLDGHSGSVSKLMSV